MSDHDDGIFRIPARRCKRCGGLLTSSQALKDGYGHTCKMKVRHEELAREEAKNQYSLFDTTKEGQVPWTRTYQPICPCFLE